MIDVLRHCICMCAGHFARIYVLLKYKCTTHKHKGNYCVYTCARATLLTYIHYTKVKSILRVHANVNVLILLYFKPIIGHS